MTSEEATAITEWVAKQEQQGVTVEQMEARVAANPAALAAEIGVPLEALSADIFEEVNSDEILDAMVATALKACAS